MNDHVDPIPHVLVIEDNPGTDPADVVWHVRHLPDCPKETWDAAADFSGKYEPMEHYICRVQACLDGIGLDDIEDWHKLSVGEHGIRSYYEYQPGDFGGHYDADHAIYLMLDES